METALDCIGLQLPVCVVLDGSRYYKYVFICILGALAGGLTAPQL